MESWAAPVAPAKRPRGPESVSSTLVAPSAQHDQQSKILLHLTAKLALQTAQVVRDHSAALQHTAIMPLDCEVSRAMFEMGKRYFDERRGNSTAHALQGAPHYHVWGALVLALIKNTFYASRHCECS